MKYLVISSACFLAFCSNAYAEPLHDANVEPTMGELRSAALYVEEAGDVEARDSLLHLALSDDASVRQRAVRTLGEIGDDAEDVREILSERCSPVYEESAAVRDAAADALAKLTGEDDAPEFASARAMLSRDD